MHEQKSAQDAPATRRRGWKELTGVSDWNPESPLFWKRYKPSLQKCVGLFKKLAALTGCTLWSGAREAESGSLLRSCAPKGYRGFESPLLRITKRWRVLLFRRNKEKLCFSLFLQKVFLKIAERWGIRTTLKNARETLSVFCGKCGIACPQTNAPEKNSSSGGALL